MTIDETEFQKNILNYIQTQKPDIGEERQQRLVQLATDILTLTEKTTGTQKWFSRADIIFFLNKFDRLQSNDTNEEIQWVIDALWKLHRLAGGGEYFDARRSEYVQKFVFNENFRYYHSQKPVYVNPFV